MKLTRKIVLSEQNQEMYNWPHPFCRGLVYRGLLFPACGLCRGLARGRAPVRACAAAGAGGRATRTAAPASYAAAPSCAAGPVEHPCSWGDRQGGPWGLGLAPLFHSVPSHSVLGGLQKEYNIKKTLRHKRKHAVLAESHNLFSHFYIEPNYFFHRMNTVIAKIKSTVKYKTTLHFCLTQMYGTADSFLRLRYLGTWQSCTE